MNIQEMIIPKSDQLNADDLVSDSMIITVTGAKPGPEDQPVHVEYEGCGQRVYKPNKTMRKVCACCWGAETDEWIGRSMKLERDPDVTWAGVAVGGIVITAMTDIGSVRRLSLNKSRGKKKEYVIEVLDMSKVKKPSKTKNPLAELKAELVNSATDARLIDFEVKTAADGAKLESVLIDKKLLANTSKIKGMDESGLRELIERVNEYAPE